MGTNTRNKAEKFWDRAAAGYDREEAGDAAIYQQVIEKAKARLQPTDTVLDFGCGTGRITARFSESVKFIRGIDLSSKMIELARTGAAKPNIEYLQADLFDIRLQPAAYDAVLGFYILHLADDPQMTLERIHSLLKPGGMLLSATPCMGEKPVLGALFAVLGKVGLLPPIRSFKQADLEKRLAAAGFEIARSERLAGTSNQYFILAKK